jgi:hypothetical protein
VHVSISVFTLVVDDVLAVKCVVLVVGITNYERGDNPGSTIITV